MDSILVVGTGSIGLRHIRNLGRLEPELDVFAYDASETAREAAAVTGARLVETLEAGFAANPGAVLVCTPPDAHVSVATAALEARAHVFVEKPLSSTLEGTGHLIQKAKDLGLVLYVGYNWRFDPGLRRLKDWIDRGELGRVLAVRSEFGQYLPEWRPDRDYRDNYIVDRDRGGILLDGSHEIDTALWLAGDEPVAVGCYAEQVSELEMQSEDLAEVTIRLRGGGVAQVHLDCVQHGYARSCKVLGSSGTAEWVMGRHVCLRKAGSSSWREESLELDMNGLYIREVEHFLRVTRGEERPASDGENGRRVLEIVLACRKAARERREVEV